MYKFTTLLKYATLSTVIVLSGCAVTETNTALETRKVASYNTAYNGPRHTLVVGSFNNRSNYQRGIFSDGTDRLGTQAKTILQSHLQQTNRFDLVDRDVMDTLSKEASLSNVQQSIQGASVAVKGSVSEFGRRNTGDKQLFGILGAGKTQTAIEKLSGSVVLQATTLHLMAKCLISRLLKLPTDW